MQSYRKYRYKKKYRLKRKTSIFLNKFFWLAILILVVLGGVFYFLVFSSFFQIKEIEISGNQKVSGENLEDFISNQVNKKIIFFISRSIFLIKSRKIREKVLEEFPQIREASLKRSFPDIIKVEIKERAPIGIWCQGDDCFNFDENGVIFEKGEGKLELTIKNDVSKRQVFLGEKAIEEKHLEAILEIQKELRENFKIDVREFILAEGEKLIVKTSEDWEIYFNAKENISDQIFNLSLVLKEKIPPEKRKNLEYIDLRFGSRVFLMPELVNIINKD